MKFRLLIFFLFSPVFLYAQVNTNFTQFFINPYLYNPSYAGADAQSSLFVSYRNQWTGFEGAPSVANASFHSPAGKNVGVGINLSNEEKSILQTSSAMLSFSYAIPLGTGSFLRFGISGGGAFSGVDLDEIEDLADPAFSGLMENNLFLIGNAGLSLQIKTFQLGISAPNIFTEKYVTTENFTVGEIEPLEQLVINASNRFYFADGRHIFEPTILYRYSDVLPPQIEAAAVFHFNHTFWAGGSYKQDFGISALAGLKLNQKFGFGYSYSLANSGINEINSPTHEVHVSILLGEKVKDRTAYSFIHSEKEKKKIVRRPPVAKKEEPKVEEPKEEKVVEEEKKEEEAEVEKEPIVVVPEEPETVPEETKKEEQPVVEEKPDVTPAPEERRVVVKRGDHLLELEEGNYVVVGAFSSYENAERFSDQLFAKGYPTKFGFTTEKNLWYVYLFRSGDLSQARQERDRIRQNKLFSKAWVLSVEE
ncbi:MAG: PorP/SprF family type IX secretion system membrane protein [Candidatus Cyclobacteriaceae bacterium M2_1C_046]